MLDYGERIYRTRISPEGLVSFNVCVKETDLWISSDRDLKKETKDLVFDYRYQLENYIKLHPSFLTSLKPYPDDPYAPLMVRDMIRTTRELGVGPMASVAGAIAQYICLELLKLTNQVIVENGGDIFLSIRRRLTVSIFAGESPLSEKIGIVVPTRLMPVGICSSSGKVGHSLSMGSADVICLISSSAVIADGAATALGNRIDTKNDLDKVPEWAGTINGILGGAAIMGDRMVAWGDIELIDL